MISCLYSIIFQFQWKHFIFKEITPIMSSNSTQLSFESYSTCEPYKLHTNDTNFFWFSSIHMKLKRVKVWHNSFPNIKKIIFMEDDSFNFPPKQFSWFHALSYIQKKMQKKKSNRNCDIFNIIWFPFPCTISNFIVFYGDRRCLWLKFFSVYGNIYRVLQTKIL